MLRFVTVTVIFLYPHLENCQRKETKAAEEKAHTGKILNVSEVVYYYFMTLVK